MILYYITDRQQFPGSPAEQRLRLLTTIHHCAEAGVDMVQLREKDLPARDLENLARQAMAAVAGSPTRLLINARVDVAIAVGAAGVHLPSGNGQLPPSEARVVCEKSGLSAPMMGVSCHNAEDVEYAEAHGADFAVFGPVFEKSGSPNPEGIAALSTVCSRALGSTSRMPILALGGLTIENAAAALAAGASGIAGIRMFQSMDNAADDLPSLVRKLRALAIPQTVAPFRHPYQP